MSAFRLSLSLCLVFHSISQAAVQGPQTFRFNELVQLATVDPPPPPLAAKLHQLLSTPFISNEAAAQHAQPKIPQLPGLGPVLRVAEWNINRGENESDVEDALSCPNKLVQIARRNPSLNAKDIARLKDEITELDGADVVILDEVDDGVKRTRYRNVAHDLAEALNMNYVYAVEFVELNRIYLGAKNLDQPDKTRNRNGQVFGVDPNRYLGLEGSAILSRYPIRDARIVRLPELYDWYHQEIQAISDLEQARRWTAETLFEERIERQVRRGGRMAIVVDLEIPQSPTGIVTIVCPHLEDYTGPKGRQRQMEFLLGHLREVSNPVVLGGDLNTTGSSAQPITIRREIFKYLKDYRFWIRQVFFFFTPVPGLGYAFRVANYFKNYHDPSAFNVPILLPNHEKALFQKIGSFRFSDGGRFDFQGKQDASYRDHGSTLADSNQRAWKGFTPTFSFQRTYHGLVGEYKLDWFFVKPSLAFGNSESSITTFKPYFGRTLPLVNSAPDARISDHCPITVNLPIGR